MANKVTKIEDQNTENQTTREEQPKKESLLKRSWKRFGRDLLDIGIGVGIGGFVVASVFKARAGKADEAAPESEDQETEEEEVLEVCDE